MQETQTGGNRELVVPPYQQAYVRDDASGTVQNIVGPQTEQLQKTFVPVRFSASKHARDGSIEFEKCTIEQAIVPWAIAREGYYIVLHNPAKNQTEAHPEPKTSGRGVDLNVGEKVVIPGPASFALHPGQFAQIVKGHSMAANDFLVCKVYNEAQATSDRGQMVVKPAEGGDAESGGDETKKSKQSSRGATKTVIPSDLHMGTQFVIRGTDVSFFIPPTGIEVVKDPDAPKGTTKFVRHAATLQDLELAILLDQTGGRRYAYGPAVVFPSATETFVLGPDKQRKFRAVELNPQTGLHIKVIADYEETDDDQQKLGLGSGKDNGSYRRGDEIFVTGDRTRIYYPRAEHNLINHGEDDDGKIFAVAVPSGEGRYVLDKNTGEVETVIGPDMMLIDPRNKVFVRRILTDAQCKLWFPGNQEVLDYNRGLRKVAEPASRGRYVSEDRLRASRSRASLGLDPSALESLRKGPSYDATGIAEALRSTPDWAAEESADGFGGGQMQRKEAFTPPRTIELDTKFEGAVRISVHPGYAVMVASRTGERRVVTGPDTILLQYDEELESFALTSSKGVAKRDVYLGVNHNRVRSLLSVTTSDFVDVDLVLRYRVRFTGEAIDWFAIEDYPKLVRESMASRIKNMATQHKVGTLLSDGIDLLRDCVLGEKPEEGPRPERKFQNGAMIYDLEVSDITIAGDVAHEVEKAQRAAVVQELDVQAKQRLLEATRAREEIERQIADEQFQTAARAQDRARQLAEQLKQTKLTELTATAETDAQAASNNMAVAVANAELEEQALKVLASRADVQLNIERSKHELRAEELQAQTAAFVEQVQAVDPELSAKLKILADSVMSATLFENFDQLALLKGRTMPEVLAQLASGSPGLESVLQLLPKQVQVGTVDDLSAVDSSVAAAATTQPEEG